MCGSLLRAAGAECTRKFVRIKKRAMADQTSILEFFNVTHGARVRTFGALQGVAMCTCHVVVVPRC